jgi:hypothetical protein
VWDSGSGRLLLTLEGHTGAVLSASFSPDGTRIVTGSWDKTARVWMVPALPKESAALVALAEGLHLCPLSPQERAAFGLDDPAAAHDATNEMTPDERHACGDWSHDAPAH